MAISSVSTKTAFGILLVVFKRPDNLRNKLIHLLQTGYPLYIYVDFDEQNSTENTSVISIVKLLASIYGIQHYINFKNDGPGYAIPNAINWAFNFQENLLILEDDCELGPYALSYFDRSLVYKTGKNVIISGRSPWEEDSNFRPDGETTLTIFPLTNGWLISKNDWNIISYYLTNKMTFGEIFKAVIKNLKQLDAICFFYSACLYNYFLERKAWDCFIVMKMIIEKYYAIIPDYTVVSTKGIDSVASNTTLSNVGNIRAVAEFSNRPPGQRSNFSSLSTLKNDRQIKKNIYSIKFYHLLSPMKSWFKILLYKLK